jgi:hypothetical protein
MLTARTVRALNKKARPGLPRTYHSALLMTNDIDIPTTLRPGRTKTAGRCLACLIFVVIGIAMVRTGEPAGYFCGGFFALCLPVFAIQFHPGAAYLRLAPEGFTFCSLFRSHTVRWTDVCEFGAVTIGGNRMVAWNFAPEYTPPGRVRRISKSLYGYEAALPDTYGLKAQELAELMEGLRQRYGFN